MNFLTKNPNLKKMGGGGGRIGDFFDKLAKNSNLTFFWEGGGELGYVLFLTKNPNL